MILSLQTHRLQTLDEVRGFLAGSESVDLALTDRESAYRFAEETLVRFRYHARSKAAKGVILRYLVKMTGKSPPQVQRLVRQHRETGRVRDRRGVPACAFVRRYTKADAGLLAEVDAALGQRCGHATRAVMRRMYEEYGDERFERLASISNGHFYNLRKSKTYRRRRTTFRKTRARRIAIGERRKPRPKGRPGSRQRPDRPRSRGGPQSGPETALRPDRQGIPAPPPAKRLNPTDRRHALDTPASADDASRRPPAATLRRQPAPGAVCRSRKPTPGRIGIDPLYRACSRSSLYWKTLRLSGVARTLGPV